MFKTAYEIPPKRQLQHQLAFQEWTDNAVSKTINLPNSATSEDIDTIYRNAWKGGAKGITVYRDLSKTEQVIYQGLGKRKIPTCKTCIV